MKVAAYIIRQLSNGLRVVPATVTSRKGNTTTAEAQGVVRVFDGCALNRNLREKGWSSAPDAPHLTYDGEGVVRLEHEKVYCGTIPKLFRFACKVVKKRGGHK